MPTLHETIKQLVSKERYLVGEHAAMRLEERGILEWQAVEILDQCMLVNERLGSKPNPTIEVTGQLPNGDSLIAVWAYLKISNVAKLVTVFIPE